MKTRQQCVCAVFLAVVAATTAAVDCNIEDYYGDLYDDLVALTRPYPELADDLNALLVNTHNVVSYNGAWEALKELDQDPSNPTEVILIYSNRSMPASQNTDASGWNREHLWPRSYGLGDNGPDYSDLHNLRACDWNVNSARGNLFYGVCIPGTDAGCTSPAHAEAAPDTAKNSKLFLADSGFRGDIARAVMYMTLRYRGSETNTFLLTLSDCPCSDQQRFGNLTTLYSWHTADAVDSREQLRNQLACENWQHNRNPFVDFPDLVDYFYDYARDAGLLHAGCGEPCAPPDEDDDDGAPDCDDCSLQVGDVVVLGFNSDDPDEIYLSPLVDLPAGLKFTITDGGWEGTALRMTEGFAQYTAPAGGVSAGSIITYTGIGGQWAGTALSLSTSGDQVLVFQGSQSAPEFVFAVDFNGGWVGPGTSPTTSNSQLPPGLDASSSLSLANVDNAVYSGILSGTRAELLSAITNAANWLTSGSRLTYSEELEILPDGGDDDDDDGDDGGDDDGAALVSATPSTLSFAIVVAAATCLQMVMTA